jgi:large subunit ribosomal protein L21
MYAIFEAGGKQFKVGKDDTVMLDLISAKDGDKVSFDTVTVYRDDKTVEIGAPYLKNVTVEGKVVNPLVKGDKITVFKYKSKVNYRVKTGHRQKYSAVQITGIKTKTASKAKAENSESESAE